MEGHLLKDTYIIGLLGNQLYPTYVLTLNNMQLLGTQAGKFFWRFLPQTPSLSLTQNVIPYQFLGPYNIVLPQLKSFEVGHFISYISLKMA